MWIYVCETVYLLIRPGLAGVEMIIRVCLRTGFITSFLWRCPSADEAMDGWLPGSQRWLEAAVIHNVMPVNRCMRSASLCRSSRRARAGISGLAALCLAVWDDMKSTQIDPFYLLNKCDCFFCAWFISARYSEGKKSIHQIVIIKITFSTSEIPLLYAYCNIFRGSSV